MQDYNTRGDWLIKTGHLISSLGCRRKGTHTKQTGPNSQFCAMCGRRI